MRYFLLFFLIFSVAAVAKCQLPEDSVKAVVNKMFTAMKNSDADLMKTCFADSAILQTIIQMKDGSTKIQNESVHAFVSFISKTSKDDLDERIVFEFVKADAALAIAWTPYSFYYKGKFCHCGVNSFQLVRFNNEWKIQYLIDTRKKTGCK